MYQRNDHDILSLIVEMQDLQGYQQQNWEGSFTEYLDIVRRQPRVTRTAFQRIHDMILSHGTEEYLEHKKRMVHYKFFEDLFGRGKDAVYGLDGSLMKMVNIFKSAARRYGTEKRVLLLHGPVGSSKSTIVRLLKKGLEEYSRTDAGALYSFSWVGLEHVEGNGRPVPCPMSEEPLHLIPLEFRGKVLAELNRGLSEEEQVMVEGELCPFCRQNYREILRKYEGDWTRLIQHVRVRRVLLSEKDRVGIGTFQPKDEKNQDATELTGDINYRKIAEYGSDSDPRAFNFDGEFNIANRGIIEFIEVLKLDVAFLYDLLGASQEHKIKPKKFAQTDIDEVIIGHTNEPEYRKLQKNEFMEALRDRTVKIDIPYITRWSDEVKIYQKDYGMNRIRGKHVAPHTLEMAAMWAVLTRLEEPKKAQLTALQKLK
ncbi:MAG: serine protein kinase, partial [Candidatus Tectomicrobia bacterium]|nr:serine protein kinase [Candidatus Tectomicrobia bacterium]